SKLNTLLRKSYFSTLHTGISLSAAFIVPASVSCLKLSFCNNIKSHIIRIFLSIKVFLAVDKSFLSLAVDTQRMSAPDSNITMLPDFDAAYLFGNAKLLGRIDRNHLQRILFGGPAIMYRFSGLVIQVSDQFTAIRVNAGRNSVSIQYRSIEGSGVIYFKLISPPV